MTIEECTKQDIDDLYTLFCEWDIPHICSAVEFADSFERIFNESLNTVFIAKENGTIIGYVQVLRLLVLGMPVSFEVTELLVSKAQRSHGTGTALLEKAEAYAFENGGTEITLSSQLYRSRAHVFYESNGYTCNRMSKFYEKHL